MKVNRMRTTPRMSKAVAAGGMVWLAGIVSEKNSGSIEEEMSDILASIDELLLEAGSDRSHLVSAQFWLSDLRFYDEMNAVWDRWLPPGCAPARACTQSSLARPNCRIEVMVTAVSADREAS